MNKGILSAIAAYTLWGLFPIYWKLLHNVPSIQIIGHRIVWSFVLLIVIIFLKKKWKQFRRSVFSFKIFGIYLVTSSLLTINWFIFVYAVNTERIVETSLGYFINPLFSVMLGMVFLKEKLRSLQWVAVLIAAVGVIYLTIIYGKLPWIALSLSFTFGLYGLIKKIAPLESLYGLTFETALVTPIALGYLIFLGFNEQGVFLSSDIPSKLLLLGTGAVTSLPLLLFAYSARKIPLSTVGILQYIAPLLQFSVGVLIYNERFGRSDIIGFGIVWSALIIFMFEKKIKIKKSLHQTVQ